MEEYGNLIHLKTLLVDDDEFYRSALKAAFSEKDYFMETAASAEEGLKALETEKFDIIVINFDLPGMSGLEFLKQVMVAYPHAITILISAFGDEETISRTYEIGVDDFLQKPFSLQTLLATLAMHIRKVEDIKV
jgi:DNA-binding response OmpR family regulator